MLALRLTTAVLRPNNITCRLYNKIVLTDDASTIVALHREPDFPYEHSRPLPIEEVDNNVLRMNDMDEIQRVFGGMKPEIARNHLCSVTLTTKHRWFPRARDKKAKKSPMNRPYL